MFNRNKNDKGKTSQQTRMKISQKLKAKAKQLKGKASTEVRKGIIKGAGAAGYATGRVGTEIASRPNVANAVGKAGSAVGKLASKLPKGKPVDKKDLPKVSLRDQVTAGRATGAFLGGAAKGTYKGLEAAEKRQNKKK